MFRERLRSIGPLTRTYQFFCLSRRVAALESQVRVLRDREWTAGNELAALRVQMDHLLSCAQVPPGLQSEYLQWKEGNPVPAEPLVSVCVATYNRASLLMERCVASVLRQTYENLELIVVGDGCTDGTEQAIAGRRDPRLRFVNLPQRGTYPADPMLRWMVAGTPAMNTAMSMARGHYVTHLDDDDEYTPDRLEKLVAFAAGAGCDFVWHPFWLEDAGGNWVLREALDLALGQVTTSSVFYRSWFTRIPWDIGAYRLREPGDWNRFRRIKHIAPDARRCPEPLLRVSRSGSQRQ